MKLPADLPAVLDEAWEKVRVAPGFLTEVEARSLTMMAALTPGEGAIVEIGSFKGRSTVGLATIAARYGLGPVVAIDPHTAPSETCPDLEGESTSFNEFQKNLRSAGVEAQVEAHRAFSQQVAKNWTRPIRLLWIDGDHTYAGAKSDFDLYSPFVIEGGVIAVHDTLHEFEGPIRVVVEDMLRSDRFGPAGFFGSIGWAQYRPRDGEKYRAQRAEIAKRAEKLIPLLTTGRKLAGISKARYKLRRALVPRAGMPPEEWSKLVSLDER